MIYQAVLDGTAFLSVSEPDMDLRVTGAAERHQVALRIGPASGHGQDVMDFLHGRISSFLQAHLAERMRRCVVFPYTLPSIPVLLPVIRGTGIPVIASVLLPLVLRAILLSFFGQARAAGEAAGAARCSGHR